MGGITDALGLTSKPDDNSDEIAAANRRAEEARERSAREERETRQASRRARRGGQGRGIGRSLLLFGGDRGVTTGGKKDTLG